ncbi:MAG: PEP-CTERM sorting domain-containing protein [Rubrivivax sp.]|nr:PEP-CTERM sorting domain-containing protein [Rubrivivax sp.]
MTRMNASLRALAGAAACALLAAAAPAQAKGGAFRAVGGVFGPVQGGQQLIASDLVVNLTGIQSFDGAGDPGNTLLTVDALAGATVDAISWNVTLSTVGESWLSEATILIVNDAGDGVVFSPGFGDDFSGSGTYADSASLVALGLAFPVGADGKLYFEFFEDFDDNVGAVDATYTAGNVTFGGIGVAAVPEPGTYGLMALGLLGVVAAARRRRAS